MVAVLRVVFKHCSASPYVSGVHGLEKMYSGTLISDLLTLVERATKRAKAMQMHNANPRTRGAEPQASVCHCTCESSESEQFPEALGLSAANRNLGLLLIVHSQLVGTLEPRNDFANAVDIHQVRAVGAPEKIRV